MFVLSEACAASSLSIYRSPAQPASGTLHLMAHYSKNMTGTRKNVWLPSDLFCFCWLIASSCSDQLVHHFRSEATGGPTLLVITLRQIANKLQSTWASLRRWLQLISDTFLYSTGLDSAWRWLVASWLYSYIKGIMQSTCIILQLNYHPAATTSLFVDEFLNFCFKASDWSIM